MSVDLKVEEEGQIRICRLYSFGALHLGQLEKVRCFRRCITFPVAISSAINLRSPNLDLNLLILKQSQSTSSSN